MANVDDESNIYKNYGTSEYFMTHYYNNDERTLYLYSTAGSLTYEQQLNDFINNNKASFLNETLYNDVNVLSRVDTNSYTTIAWDCEYYQSVTRFYKNGITIDAISILKNLYFSYGSTMSLKNIKLNENGNFVFDGTRYKPIGMVSHEYMDSGTYEMNPESFYLKKIN